MHAFTSSKVRLFLEEVLRACCFMLKNNGNFKSSETYLSFDQEIEIFFPGHSFCKDLVADVL